MQFFSKVGCKALDMSLSATTPLNPLTKQETCIEDFPNGQHKVSIVLIGRPCCVHREGPFVWKDQITSQMHGYLRTTKGQHS